MKSFASPPKSPAGKVWVLNLEMSDEFDAHSPNPEKWRLYQQSDSWGRSAAFDPRVHEAVKEEGTDNYYLAMNPMWYYEDERFSKNGRTYEFAGGAMDSRVYQTYGYFEVRIKPSNFPMGSGVFMNSRKASSETCDTKYHTELDIIENMGYNGPGSNTWWNNHQHSGSHIKPYQFVNGQCEALPYESVGSEIAPLLEIPLGFNTVGMWWINEDSVMFYNNDQYFSTVKPTRPCNLPMPVIIVMETYCWGGDDENNAANPKPLEYMFEDDFRTKEERAVMYDWVRVWKLVDIDANQFNENTDNVMFLNKPVTSNQESSILTTLVYSATEPRDIVVEVFDLADNLLGNKAYTVTEGVQSLNVEVDFTNPMPEGSNYRIVCQIRPQRADKSQYIQSDTSILSIEKEPLTTSISPDKLPKSVQPSSNGYDVQIDYVADGEMEITVELRSPEGQWLGGGLSSPVTGKGTATIHVNTSQPTTYGEGYFWKVHIRPVGTTWREEVDAIDQVYFNIEEPFQPSINIESITTPLLNNATSVDLTFSYKSNTDGKLELQIVNSTRVTVAEHYRTERLGSRTLFRSIKIDSLLTPSNDYMIVANYKPLNGEFNYVSDTLKNVSILDMANSVDKMNLSSGEIIVYPNPVNNLVNVQVHSGCIKSIDLFDVSGRIVNDIEVNYRDIRNSGVSVELSGLCMGIYVAKVSTDTKTYCVQLIKV